MLTSKDLLAAVRAAHGIPSNYRLARFLDVPEQSVHRWNSGRNTPDDPMAVKLAELAGMDPAEVVAAMHAQRSADGPLAEVFRVIAERAHQAATICLTVILSGLFTASPDASAMAADPAAPSVSARCDGLYIMSTAVRILSRTWRQIGNLCRNLIAPFADSVPAAG